MKRKFLGMFLSTSLIFSGIVAAPGVTNAESLSDIQAKKAANDAEKQKKHGEISKVKNEQAQVKKQVAAIDSKITKTTESIVKKQEELVQKEKEIEKLKEEIKELEIRIAERDKLLKERVASMQVNGGAVNYLDVILGSQSFGDFLDRILALNLIAEQDRTIIEEQRADLEALEKKKQEVENILKKIEQEVNELEGLKKQLRAQLDEKDRLLGDLKQEEDHLHGELGELENEAALIKAQEEAFKRQEEEARRAAEAAKEAERAARAEAQKQSAPATVSKSSSGGSKANVASAASKSSSSSKSSSGSSSSSSNNYKPAKASGKLIMPTSGLYQRGFGGNHKGIDISSRAKPPVRAAATGTVTRVVTGCPSRVDSCGGGFGNHVIIAHTINGERIATLYAHLENVYVSNGQSVSQGTTIGKMGNTGRVRGATGIHLHFEVHRGGYSGRGSAVDPERYF